MAEVNSLKLQALFARRGAWLLVGLLIAGLAACGAEEGAAGPADTRPDAASVDAAMDAATDAGLPADAATLPLILGLGEGALRMIEPEGEALLQRGCQGSQHIWVSLRAPTLGPGTYPLTLSLVRADGTVVVPPYTVDYDWQATEAGAEVVGVTLVVFDPLAVVDQLADIEARVTAQGMTAQARVRVRVVWGPDACDI